MPKCEPMAKARHRQPKTTDVKDKGGRPSAFRKTFIQLVYRYALLGATDRQMAEFFGVTEQTLNNWKRTQKGFFESLKRGKAEADSLVAESLFHRAKGYSHKAVKIMQHEGSSYEHEFTEHYPPDTSACIFWLKNRAGWRDKQDLEHSGKEGQPLTVEVVNELTAEQCLALAKEKGLL